MIQRIRDAILRRLWRLIFRVMPHDHLLERPIFIVGAGRSGTTALATLLGQHRALANLDEPRWIWEVVPQTDLWSPAGAARGARLRLDASDVTPQQRADIRRMFAAEVRVHGARRFVEKLPTNVHRIAFVRAIFPDALFIHMLRSGVEVAHSIERRMQKNGRWYGADDYKWRAYAELAEESGIVENADQITEMRTRGLIEWRLCVEAARRSLPALPADRWIEVRYEDLVDDPVGVTARLEAFAALSPDPALRAYATSHIARRTPARDASTLTDEQHAIAGDLLAELEYMKEAEE